MKKKMKVLSFLLATLLVFSMLGVIAAAQEAEDDEGGLLITSASAETAIAQDVIPESETGATPDQPLAYGLKRFGENVKLFFTFNQVAKAKLELALARNRLLEARTMIKAEKLADAGKAQEAHEKILDRVRKRIIAITALEAEDEADLEENVGLEEELLEHEDDIEKVETEIELEVKENLDEDEQEEADNLIGKIKNSSSETLTDIETKRETIKDRIKAIKEMSDEEIDALVEEKIAAYEGAREIRAEKSLERLNWIIATTEKVIAKLQAKDVNTTALEEKLQIAEELRQRAEELKEAEDFEGLKETIREAKDLSKEARAGKPFDETGRARAVAVITKAIARMEESGKNNTAVKKLATVIGKLTKVQIAKAEEILAIQAKIKERIRNQTTNKTAETA